MKKSTKRMVWAFFIIAVMFGSTFTYVILSVIPETNPQQIPDPTVFVVDGYLNETLKVAYLPRGYTIAEFHYYGGCCPELQLYVDALPDELLTYDNKKQLVIQKINDGAGPYFIAESIYGEAEKNTTTITDVFDVLCKVLRRPPIDCALMGSNTTAS